MVDKSLVVWGLDEVGFARVGLCGVVVCRNEGLVKWNSMRLQIGKIRVQTGDSYHGI